MTILEESSWFSPKEIFKFILKSSQKWKSKDRNPSLIPSRICHENCNFQEEFSCFSPSSSISFPVKCPWPFPFPCRAESFPEGLADIFQLQEGARTGREITWGWFQEPRAAASARACTWAPALLRKVTLFILHFLRGFSPPPSPVKVIFGFLF